MSEQPPLESVSEPEARAGDTAAVIDLTAGDRRVRSHPAGENVVLLLPEDTAAERPLVVRLQEALDVTREMILVAEPSGRILFANLLARAQLGLDEIDATFRPIDTLLTGKRRDEVWAALDTDNAWHGEISATRTDGSTIQVELTLLADRTGTGDVRSFTVVAHDVGEQRALEHALEHQTTHDGLTGLANRQHLLRLVDSLLPELDERGVPGALMIIDVDEFRTVANSLGHDAGDRILVAFAYRLLRSFPTNSVLARVGGDEFAVFCPGVDDVDALADQVTHTTTAPFYVDGSEVHLSVVTGIARFEPHRSGQSAESLLREADAAGFRAKKKGRGSFAVFEPSLQTETDDRLSLVRDLRRALRNDELRLHYQPKIDLTTGRIRGAEALLRWESPDGELRSPAAFMDLAEDTGLIIPMGRWVIEEACRAVERLAAVPGTDAGLEMSVNLSVRQLAQADFAEELAGMLADVGLDPRRLELEITESVLMDDVEHTSRILDELKQLGVRIAVDDFGTGYSSLRYLQRLPVDVLKVDRSFVADLDREDGRAIVTAVIRLAQALGLHTVAEGVETVDQLETLRHLGCAEAQGYHLGRPTPEADFAALLADPPRYGIATTG